MGYSLFIGIIVFLLVGPLWAQTDNRTIVGSGNEYLSKGSWAITMGQYDEGIRLTHLGVERYMTSPEDRASAYSNLCAAHAAKGEVDVAIEFCNESLALVGGNWRAYSNRAYAYLLKGLYSEATFDVDTAASINPRSRQVQQIRGMINEASFRPRVIVEDHQ